MIRPGTSFGCHQVVDSVYFIEVRPFNPYRMLGFVHSSVDNYLCLANGAVGGGIEFPNPDGAVSVILRFSLRRVIVYNVTFPVFIEENGPGRCLRLQEVESGHSILFSGGLSF